MQNESKAARETEIERLWKIYESSGPEYRLNELFSDIWEAAYSAAIEDAARIVENSCPCRKCGDTPRTVAEDVRSLKGNL